MRSLAQSACLWLAFPASLLAGCADESPNAESSSLALAEEAAENLEVDATASTGVIRGIVVDDAIRPVANVSIRSMPGERTTYSTAEGAFAFEDLEPGTYFLAAAKSGHASVQQSVDVVAGVDEPEIVRILLAVVAGAQPYVDLLLYDALIAGGFSAGGVSFTSSIGVLGEGSFRVRHELSPNSTWIQSELVWEASQPLATRMMVRGWTYEDDTTTTIESDRWYGANPLLTIFNGSAVSSVKHPVVDAYFDIFVQPADPIPLGVVFNQKLQLFTHVFYNRLPDPGWRFTVDGDP